jgi:hypothetical protein
MARHVSAFKVVPSSFRRLEIANAAERTARSGASDTSMPSTRCSGSKATARWATFQLLI